MKIKCKIFLVNSALVTINLLLSTIEANALETRFDYPKRNQYRLDVCYSLKIRFVQALPPTEGRSSIRMAKGERVIWQRRFWEHAIRDEGDHARHMDYVQFNRAKHGYVSMVAHWPHSTFHRWVKAGAYPRDWSGEGPLDAAAGERR